MITPSQTSHMSAGEHCEQLGISQGTANAKATQVMDMLDILQMHPDWSLSSRLDENPLAWLIHADGFLVDARYAPCEIQEEAFRLGLIAYAPALGTPESLVIMQGGVSNA